MMSCSKKRKKSHFFMDPKRFFANARGVRDISLTPFCQMLDFTAYNTFWSEFALNYLTSNISSVPKNN